MKEELNNFIMVWSSILMSACYCYGISKLFPKGTVRFIMFLPVLCLFFILPLNLNSVNLILPTAFFVTWLATFKLLLLVFGTGPLSDPSLSWFHFVLIACLPVVLQRHAPSKSSPPQKTQNKENSNKKDTNRSTYPDISPSPSLHLAKKSSILVFLIVSVSHCKDKLPQNIFLLLVCIYVYIGLEVMLGVIATIGQFLFGTAIEPPFLEPYFSTSLRDFWGRRWNRISSSILRSAVFNPILHHASQVVDRKWAALLALLVTFGVSDMMHEIMFYYVGRKSFGWGTPFYFLLQGTCVEIEGIIKTKIDGRWRLPQIIMGPLVFGFAIGTFMLLVLPELTEHNVDGRALEEWAALGAFLKRTTRIVRI